MVIAFPTTENERTAMAMLRMMLDHGHIDEDGVFRVPLEDWEIDLLSSYGVASEDLEDSDDDEDDAVVTQLNIAR